MTESHTHVDDVAGCYQRYSDDLIYKFQELWILKKVDENKLKDWFEIDFLFRHGAWVFLLLALWFGIALFILPSLIGEFVGQSRLLEAVLLFFGVASLPILILYTLHYDETKGRGKKLDGYLKISLLDYDRLVLKIGPRLEATGVVYAKLPLKRTTHFEERPTLFVVSPGQSEIPMLLWKWKDMTAIHIRKSNQHEGQKLQSLRMLIDDVLSERN